MRKRVTCRVRFSDGKVIELSGTVSPTSYYGDDIQFAGVSIKISEAPDEPPQSPTPNEVAAVAAADDDGIPF